MGAAPATVVLVHGLAMQGWDMELLRRRLEGFGYEAALFRYPSRRRPLEDNAELLDAYVRGRHAARLHFVAHSLGGLLIRHLFHRFPEQPPGRVVTLGTPHAGSAAAKVLARSRLGRLFLGHSIDGGLLGDVPPWHGRRELGVLAGDLAIGFGHLVGSLEEPSDGTIGVSETRLAGMADHLVLPVSHIGMLLSAPVAAHTAYFLEHGRFFRTPGAQAPDPAF